MVSTNSSTIEREKTPSMTGKKYRVQLDFSQKDFTEINALVGELDLGTRAELFRSALVSLRWMVEKKRTGCTIVAITPADKLLEPEFEFLQSMSKNYAHATTIAK